MRESEFGECARWNCDRREVEKLINHVNTNDIFMDDDDLFCRFRRLIV